MSSTGWTGLDCLVTHVFVLLMYNSQYQSLKLNIEQFIAVLYLLSPTGTDRPTSIAQLSTINSKLAKNIHFHRNYIHVSPIELIIDCEQFSASKTK